ncbi:hypothetical protein GQ42DRAFT_156629 [Ramicandelaber brevisporus]|nr:hypothetical protein GQ42DRAFT_156629 [Ramicandelaber brevisporus]
MSTLLLLPPAELADPSSASAAIAAASSAAIDAKLGIVCWPDADVVAAVGTATSGDDAVSTLAALRDTAALWPPDHRCDCFDNRFEDDVVVAVVVAEAAVDEAVMDCGVVTYDIPLPADCNCGICC